MKRLLWLALVLPGIAFGQVSIHNLPAASSANTTDEIPATQGGTTTRKVTVSQIGTALGVSTCAAMPALTGDTTSSAGSCATTVSKVNGALFPTSAAVIGSNASAQPIAATTTGTGSVVLATAPTIANLTVTGTCTGCGSGSSVTLQTNGTNNTSQTTLNLQSGQGIAVTNPSSGNVSIASNVPQRTVTTSPTVASTDMGGLIVMNVTGGGTLTVPAISSTVLASGMSVGIVNYSASTAAVSTTPTINSGGGCVSGTGIPSGDTWQLFSNGTSLDCIQTVSASSGGGGAQQQVINWICGTIAQNSSSYTAPASNGGSVIEGIATFSGTLKNLYFRATNAPASGQTYTITLETGAPGSPGASTVTCTVTSSSSNNLCSDTTDSVAITAGQAWTVLVATSATSGSTGNNMVAVELDH